MKKINVGILLFGILVSVYSCAKSEEILNEEQPPKTTKEIVESTCWQWMRAKQDYMLGEEITTMSPMLPYISYCFDGRDVTKTLPTKTVIGPYSLTDSTILMQLSNIVMDCDILYLTTDSMILKWHHATANMVETDYFRAIN